MAPQVVKGLTAILVALALAAGAASLFASVDSSPHLRDADEAAWAFNGYYLDLYLSGDWENPDWRAFDRYAQHPPAANHLFGALLHAVGEPMRTMEPRRYWFENDMLLALDPGRFIGEIGRRLSARQLVAGRWMAAGFAWLAAVSLFFMARKVAGALAGLLAFALIILHPIFRGAAALATADTFFIFLTVAAVWVAAEIPRALASSRRRAWALALLLALVLGISFATKIIAFANIAAAAIAAALFCRSKRELLASAALIAMAVAAGLGVAYLLDPGLHGSPISQTLARIAWRQERIGIQQVVFVGQRLATVGQRLSFAAFFDFLSSAPGMIAALGSAACAIACTRASDLRRGAICAISLAAYYFILTIYALPMAWPRYLAAYLPFLILPAGVGAAAIVRIARGWSLAPARVRQQSLAGALAAMLALGAARAALSPREAHMPPAPTAEEIRASRGLAEKLLADHDGP